MIETPYCHYFILDHVHDGDTLVGMIDLGFNKWWKWRIRFARTNSDELNSIDPAKRAKAILARDYLVGRLPVGCKLYFVSKKLDEYDRPISEIYYNGVNLNDEMLANGLADNYKGK
jgi:endonuclease YncB( thermonuclease family)